MQLKNSTMFTLVSAAAFALAGCGSSSKPSTTATVGTAGATLTAGAATLTIPAGALTQNTTVTVREAEPKHTGRANRIEVEPHQLLEAGHEAVLAVKVDDSNPKVRMHKGSDDTLDDVEIEDRNHHAFKTHMGSLDDVEVEVEHGLACTPACGTGTECDDGVCKDHNDAAKTCATVCATTEECDDGVCKTHNEVEGELQHGGAPGTCSPTCADGLVCHDGVCSAHG